MKLAEMEQLSQEAACRREQRQQREQLDCAACGGSCFAKLGDDYGQAQAHSRKMTGWGTTLIAIVLFVVPLCLTLAGAAVGTWAGGSGSLAATLAAVAGLGVGVLLAAVIVRSLSRAAARARGQ